MFMTAYLETLTDSRRPWRCPKWSHYSKRYRGCYYPAGTEGPRMASGIPAIGSSRTKQRAPSS